MLPSKDYSGHDDSLGGIVAIRVIAVIVSARCWRLPRDARRATSSRWISE